MNSSVRDVARAIGTIWRWNQLRTWTVDSINLSDMEFWRHPWAEREAAFATLRRDRPISHYDEPVIEGTSIEFPVGNGFYALTKYRDVQTASRHPETFLSGPGAVSTMDLPSEMVEYFSGMISTDDPKHARLRRIVSNAFNPRNVRAVEDSIERKADEIIERSHTERHRRLHHRRRGARSRSRSSAT